MHVHEPIGGWLTDRMALAAGEPLVVGEPGPAALRARDRVPAGCRPGRCRRDRGGCVRRHDIGDGRHRGARLALSRLSLHAARCHRGQRVRGTLRGRATSRTGRASTCVAAASSSTSTTDSSGTATGAAVMGDPAEAVAWWVRHLARSGRGLSAGMVVLSGALMGAQTVAAGDRGPGHDRRSGHARAHMPMTRVAITRAGDLRCSSDGCPPRRAIQRSSADLVVGWPTRVGRWPSRRHESGCFGAESEPLAGRSAGSFVAVPTGVDTWRSPGSRTGWSAWASVVARGRQTGGLVGGLRRTSEWPGSFPGCCSST